jgi:hypothetical protein
MDLVWARVRRVRTSRAAGSRLARLPPWSIMRRVPIVSSAVRVVMLTLAIAHRDDSASPRNPNEASCAHRPAPRLRSVADAARY